MKKILTLTILSLSLLLLASCHDYIPVRPASLSDGAWEGVFEAYWSGMNENYVFWDLDSPSKEWDKVYDDYIDKFKELGAIDYSNKTDVKKAALLFFELSKNLSDGHFALSMITSINGADSVMFSPRTFQIAKETDPAASDASIFDKIYEGKEDDLLTDEIKYEDAISTLKNDFGLFKANSPQVYAEATAYWSEDMSDYLSEKLKEKNADFVSKGTSNKTLRAEIPKDTASPMISQYFSKWMVLNIKDNLNALVGLTKAGLPGVPANVIYIALSNFVFFQYYSRMDFPTLVFLEIFEHFKHDNSVSGMIIDLRGNTGGYNIDRQILFADMVPSDLKIAELRTKQGARRLDYGPWIPAYIEREVLSGDSSHLSNKPIVALTNQKSVSNAEVTTLMVKQFPKGRSIGGKTYGGEGCLI